MKKCFSYSTNCSLFYDGSDITWCFFPSWGRGRSQSGSAQDYSWMVQQNLNAGVLPSPAMLVWPNPVTKELARAVSGSVRAFTCPPEGHRVTARTPLASLPSWSQILVGKQPELNSWPSRKSPEQKNGISEASHSWRRGRASASLGRCSPRSKDAGPCRAF